MVKVLDAFKIHFILKNEVRTFPLDFYFFLGQKRNMKFLICWVVWNWPWKFFKIQTRAAAFNSYALNYAKIFYRIANFSPFSLCRFLLLWIDLETFSLQLLLLKVKCVFGNEMRHLTLMALSVSYSTRIHSRYDLRKKETL